MKIRYDSFQNIIEVFDYTPLIIVLENQGLYNKCISQWSKQIYQKDEIVLEIFHEETIEKRIEFLLTPFFYHKKISNLTSKLHIFIENQYLLNKFSFSEINHFLKSYIFDLTKDIQIDIDILEEPNFINLLKAYQIKVKLEEGSLLENLINYLEVLVELELVKVIIFLNLKLYFSRRELEVIYNFCKENEIQLIDIEKFQGEKINMEQYYIVDDDLCEIS